MAMVKLRKWIFHWISLIGICYFLSLSQAQAQVSRFELGRHLQAFEEAWDSTTDGRLRQQANTHLQSAFSSFFRFQFSQVAKSLDEARYCLIRSTKAITNEQRSADSLALIPESRLIDGSIPQLKFEIKPFYPCKDFPSAKTKLRIQSDGETIQEFDLNKLPQSITLKLPDLPSGKDQDLWLKWSIDNGENATSENVLLISRIVHWQQRLNKIKTQIKTNGSDKSPDLKKDNLSKKEDSPQANPAKSEIQSPLAKTIEEATLVHFVDTLENLSKGEVLETNYPAAKLMHTAEELAQHLRKSNPTPFFDSNRTGQDWVAIPVDKTPVITRIQIPRRLPRNRTIPLVIALHGAGGSENLFFEGYGRGITAKSCLERNWLFIAPRSEGFLTLPPIDKIVSALAKRYPIDPKKIFLIGHSMGAAQSLSLAQKFPEKFAAVALLGGSGSISQPQKLNKIPFFIACGKLDFGYRMAENTAKSLLSLRKEDKNQQKLIEFKSYPDIEHMMIVREAIPDLFKWLDGIASKIR